MVIDCNCSGICIIQLRAMKINPLNFFDRELSTLPPHFLNTVVKANEYDLSTMKKWIYENCRGRFSFTKDVTFTTNESKAVTVIGFEEPGDLTLFALSGLAQKTQI